MLEIWLWDTNIVLDVLLKRVCVNPVCERLYQFFVHNDWTIYLAAHRWDH